MTTTVSDSHNKVQTRLVLSDAAARLQEENIQLREELRREHEMAIRNLADFAHYHHRTKRERTQAIQAGKRELILELLDVVDDCERVLTARLEPRFSDDNVQTIYQRLTHLLSAQGVTAFASIGQRFDPTRHDVIETIKCAGKEAGTVVEELRRGYCWGDEVLRPAQVRLAK